MKTSSSFKSTFSVNPPAAISPGHARFKTTIRSVLITAGALILISCSSSSDKKEEDASSSAQSSQSSVVTSSSSSPNNKPIGEMSPNENALWKRVKTLKNDLLYALDLSEQELCNELGTLRCFDQVHLSALGGNEPFVLTQYEPVDSPNSITPIAVERVVLTACSNKVEKDRTQESTVFTEYDLDSLSEPGNAAYLSALDNQNTSLYRRLLARDPSAEELNLLHTLSEDAQGNPIDNADVAKLSCYTIATSSEFIFL